MKNKFVMKSLEYNVTHTCNLKCSYCDHLSPYFKEADSSSINIEEFRKSIEILKDYVSIGSFLILGGEPLLNKDILKFIRSVKESKIAQEIVLITNGFLLSKQPDELYQLLDRINLSVYSSAPVNEDTIKLIRNKCEEHNVKLEVARGSSFNKSITGQKNDNAKLVKAIFMTCSLAWKQKCFTMYNGSLYRCSRIPFIGYKLSQLKRLNTDISIKDGLAIKRTDNFTHEIEKYFTSSSPYKACSYCFGSVGKKVAHRQLTKDEIANDSWLNEKIKRSIDNIKLIRRLIKLKLFNRF